MRVAEHRRGAWACEVSVACRWGSDAVFQSLREDRTAEEEEEEEGEEAAAAAQDLPEHPLQG